MTSLKLMLISFLFIVNNNLFAQLLPEQLTGRIIYLRVLTFTGAEPVEGKLELFFSADQSLFIESSTDAEESPAQSEPNLTETDDGMLVTYDFSENHRWPIHFDLKTKRLKREVVLFQGGKNRQFLVTEDQFPIRWKLARDEKVIGGVLCRKASGYFRGRNYEAWYAPGIPVRMGPWKFSGLPGLILEIYDLEKQVFFSAIAINIPAKAAQIPTTWLSSGKNVATISLEESVRISREQRDEMMQAITAKLPRGAVLDLEDKEPNRIETRYEFDH